MSMKYQFIDEKNIEEIGSYIVYHDRIYTNPLHNRKVTEEMLLELGYKNLIEEDIPQEEGKRYEPYYVDGDIVITKKWREIEE